MKKLYKLWAIMAALFMVSFVALSANAQINKEVQVKITGWANNCTFDNYTLMQTGFSYAEQILESNVSGYVCTMEKGGVDGYVTVLSDELTNPAVSPIIPAQNVKIKHVDSTAVSAWVCALSNTLATTYTNVASGQTLFAKDDYTVCTVGGSTQLEVTVPASLPVGTYTGDMIFTIY